MRLEEALKLRLALDSLIRPIGELVVGTVSGGLAVWK
jgi:hypothetical protein